MFEHENGVKPSVNFVQIYVPFVMAFDFFRYFFEIDFNDRVKVSAFLTTDNEQFAIPHDSRLADVSFCFIRRSFCLTLDHYSFPKSLAGEIPPEIKWKFMAIKNFTQLDQGKINEFDELAKYLDENKVPTESFCGKKLSIKDRVKKHTYFAF